MKYNIDQVIQINKNLTELKRLNKTFPFLISKLLSDNLDRTIEIIETQSIDENISFDGIEPLYLREIRLGEIRNIQLDIETMGLLKILLK